MRKRKGDTQAALRFTAGYIEAKSRAVTLADIGELFEAQGIEGDVFELIGDLDAWRRLAISLAIDAKKLKQPYAMPPKRGRRKDINRAARDALMWIEAERLGNARQASKLLSRRLKRQFGIKITSERLRQNYQKNKKDGLPYDTRRLVQEFTE
jgi:hypothetical protein